MKNILILLISLFSLNLFSQAIDYPIIHVDSLGKTVVTMTIEQAQILDNKAELLELIEKANSQMVSMDIICINVINDKDAIIARQDIQIDDLKSLAGNKDEQIENLQKQIIDYKMSEILFNKELFNKDKEIELHIGEVKRVKRKMTFGGIASGVIIAALATIIIVN